MSSDLVKEIDRGAQAKQVLEHPLFDEAFDSVLEHFRSQWEDSGANEQEFRDLCWRALKSAQLFRQFFEKTISNGRVAEEDLARIRKNKEGFPRKSAPYGAIV